MTSKVWIPFLGGLLVTACSANSDSTGSGAGAASTAGPTFDVDYDVPRYCTVTAYQSVLEAGKFAVGDYAIASIASQAPDGIPLSKWIWRDANGRPTQARFGIYFRHDATHQQMLTPYSPMPLASEDSTSMTLATPPDVSTTDVSTLVVSKDDARQVLSFTFREIVHSDPSRSITFECTTTPSAPPATDASAPDAGSDDDGG